MAPSRDEPMKLAYEKPGPWSPLTLSRKGYEGASLVTVQDGCARPPADASGWTARFDGDAAGRNGQATWVKPTSESAAKRYEVAPDGVAMVVISR